MKRIPFNKAYFSPAGLDYIRQAFDRRCISGGGEFTACCQRWIEETTGCQKAILCHSGTAALEMAAILADIGPGDEIIMPSYTFVSTANAFVLRGGVPVFVDIRSDIMTIDASLIETALLLSQKEMLPEITAKRMRIWDVYAKEFQGLAAQGRVELPCIPDGCRHAAHMFYLKTRRPKEREALLRFLQAQGIDAVFHYVPLHSSPARRRFSRFHGEDRYTTRESARLIRLPLFVDLDQAEQDLIIDRVRTFFE